MAVYTSGNGTGFSPSALWVANTLLSTNERFEGLVSEDIDLLTRTERYAKFVFESGGLTYEYEGQWTVSASSGILTTQVATSGVYFTIREDATARDDYIIYKNKTGYLYYDRDGSGSGKVVEIAKLSSNLKITYHDFYVI